LVGFRNGLIFWEIVRVPMLPELVETAPLRRMVLSREVTACSLVQI